MTKSFKHTKKTRFPMPFVVLLNGDTVIANFVHLIQALHFARDVGGQVCKIAENGRDLTPVDTNRP